MEVVKLFTFEDLDKLRLTFCTSFGSFSLMALLLSLKSVTKTIGDRNLFTELSFGINEGEKLGLIGPNGAGKSSLLKLIAEEDQPSSGEITSKNGIRISFIRQEPKFDEAKTALEEVVSHLVLASSLDSFDAEVSANIALSQCGFEEPNIKIESLSGGWRKRLAIAKAIAIEPDLLLMDEPTNHMDWDGLFWLESLVKNLRCSLVLVSHDRSFLDRVTNKTMEINPVFQKGFLAFDCSYYRFLNKKEEYISGQLSAQESLSNVARRELDWLRAGVKARTTKSRSRQSQAHQLLDQLDEMKSRNLQASKKSRLEIESTGVQAKKMLAFKGLKIQYPDGPILIENLNLELGAKTCFGILGENGTGKSSLLKVITGENKDFEGECFLREDLKVVYFDQKRYQLNREESLVNYLGDGSDHIVFKDKSIHVASYASRFLFDANKLNVPIKKLSGGEQARLMIAKLLLQPADILILDEPTNDLDIDTIELLEEAISGFSGLVLLVSHDRSFLTNLADRFLALEGEGRSEFYADVEQWLSKRNSKIRPDLQKENKKEARKAKPKKIKLSFKEKLRLEGIEEEVFSEEELLEQLKEQMSDPEVLKDHLKLGDLTLKIDEQQSKINALYDEWNALEEKKTLSESTN